MIQNNNLYECPIMQDALGEYLRPGGFETTRRAVEFCKFTSKDLLLDLGCGKGATIKYLRENYKIEARGLDISASLAEDAKSLNEDAQIVVCRGEDLPFSNDYFDGVLAECTLSLMDLGKVIDEVYRVTRAGGCFIISDIFADKVEFIDELHTYSVNTCLKNPHNLYKLKDLLENKGFNILLEEKNHDYMKQLAVRIIFQHGSMENFWNKSISATCSEGGKFQDSLKKAKLGYFLMIAQKGDKDVK